MNIVEIEKNAIKNAIFLIQVNRENLIDANECFKKISIQLNERLQAYFGKISENNFNEISNVNAGILDAVRSFLNNEEIEFVPGTGTVESAKEFIKMYLPPLYDDFIEKNTNFEISSYDSFKLLNDTHQYMNEIIK